MIGIVVAWIRGIFKRPEQGQAVAVVEPEPVAVVTKPVIARERGRQRAKRMGLSSRDWEQVNGRKWVPV